VIEPPPDVELVPYDPAWSGAAAAERLRLIAALGSVLVEVHHIGSTSVPGLTAKPIVDLLGVAVSLAALDAGRSVIEGLGYEWRGEYGLSGRRYCTWNEPASGQRRIQLHCYAEPSSEIERHLAFRDALRDEPALAAAYAAEKRRCLARHADDGRAYGLCKSEWIGRVEAEALAARAQTSASSASGTASTL
jgi:GrpB-like predicted nucleotidyltransferase (UPF0157 family)